MSTSIPTKAPQIAARLLAFSLIAMVGCITQLAHAEEATAEEEGFTTLFNGKDLTGWIGSTTGYEVRDGILVCPAGKGKGGRIFVDKEYANFVFRFDFKLTPGANNGLGIRTPTKGDPAYVGYEVQILDNSSERYAKLKDYQFHGSIYKLAAAKRGHLKPVGEWNSEEVIADGNEITVILNGTVIVDKFDVSAAKRPSKGHVGFLGHGSEVEFRNVRIKELP